MPFLVIPILGVLSLLGVGGLVFKTTADEFDDTINSTTPNLVTLGAVAIAGFAVWTMAKGRRK